MHKHYWEPIGVEAVMATVDPIFLKATCFVCAGDEICLHIDPPEDHVRDGVFFIGRGLPM